MFRVHSYGFFVCYFLQMNLMWKQHGILIFILLEDSDVPQQASQSLIEYDMRKAMASTKSLKRQEFDTSNKNAVSKNHFILITKSS